MIADPTPIIISATQQRVIEAIVYPMTAHRPIAHVMISQTGRVEREVILDGDVVALLARLCGYTVTLETEEVSSCDGSS